MISWLQLESISSHAACCMELVLARPSNHGTILSTVTQATVVAIVVMRTVAAMMNTACQGCKSLLTYKSSRGLSGVMGEEVVE